MTLQPHVFRYVVSALKQKKPSSSDELLQKMDPYIMQNWWEEGTQIQASTAGSVLSWH